MTAITSSLSAAPVDPRHMGTAAILDDCCANSVVCRFQLAHSGDSMTASFHSQSRQGIEFVVSPPENGRFPRSQAIVCVSFPFRTSFCAFLVCVTDVQQLNSGKCLVVSTVPEDVTITNLRQSFRVPVIRHSGLETILRTSDDQTFHVNALDIAESGIEVEFEAGTDSGLAVGSSVIVELRFRGEVIQRTAEVRRIYADRCGLYFENSADESGHRVAARLHGLVLAIQQLWLKSRLS